MEVLQMTFNDYILKYLKEDRNPLIPFVVDKYNLKRFAKQFDIATPTTIYHDTDTFVAKATNDSGSCMIVKNKKIVSGNPNRLMRAKYQPYGLEKGEWFYEYIPFNIIKERYLADNITDYKFHCHQGKVMFCQVIFDRGNNTKECIVFPDGTKIQGYRLDEKFKLDTNIKLADNYKDMIKKSEELCKFFNYVRVDMYSINNIIYLGELTFGPRAGRYTGIGQRKLGLLF